MDLSHQKPRPGVLEAVVAAMLPEGSEGTLELHGSVVLVLTNLHMSVPPNDILPPCTTPLVTYMLTCTYYMSRGPCWRPMRSN